MRVDAAATVAALVHSHGSDMGAATPPTLGEDARSAGEVRPQDQELLRLFVQHTPNAVAMVDRDMRYLLVSGRWLEDFGLGGRDASTLEHYELFPQLPEHWKAAHKRCLAGETVSAREDRVVRPDGEIVWLRWELVPWRTADGAVGGMLVFTELITERKLSEQALRKSHEELEQRVAERTQALHAAKDAADRANALKSRFLAAASHDLRQPLQAAMAYLSMLGPKLGEPEKTLGENARRSLDSMAEILDLLLDLAEIEAGSLRTEVSDFNVGELADRTLASHWAQAEEKGLALRFEGAAVFARSDRRLIGRVVDNLVSNAIRYTAQGEVVVRSERDGGVVRISVSDTGVGIPPESVELVFEPYAQLDNPARDRRKGLGLGLAIVRQILSVLGHTIQVRSSPGAGSTFTFELPAAEPPAELAEPPARGAAAPVARRPVVLFVEDNPIVALSLQLMLTEAGFDVHEAGKGEEALALVDSGVRPDVIMSDYRLPTFDGLEVIRRVRAAVCAEVPAVLVTGDTALAATGPATPPDCTILYKPVQPEELASVIGKLASRGGVGATIA
jgi:PAS domain S-box-containing protein